MSESKVRRYILLFTAVWACGWRRPQVVAAAAHRLKGPDHNPTRRFKLKSGMAPTALQRALMIRAGSTPQPTPPGNKKYTAAAASAMQTLNSLSSKTRQPNIPNLLSESALMDKETNAIYWQGGAKIFSTSLSKPYLTQRGILHVKATILTIALWLWVWGKLSRHLATKYFGSKMGTVEGHQLLFALPFISAEKAPPFLQNIASVFTPIIQFILLLFHSILYLRLPEYSTKVITVTIILYLLESYSCSTRRYLSHALNAPAEVESYLEKIRNAEPTVTWKVRCFHYEDRDLWKNWKGAGKIWETLMRKREEEEDNGSDSANAEPFVESPPSWLAKKVVTHQAVGTYKFGSWEDHTLASTWKRSESYSSTSQEAPFSKLSITKLLLLRDKDAREDYFAQQAAFVMLQGRKDVHAEFATNIDLEGFRPRLLAVRPVRRASNISAALFRQHIFILFTILGLSLPYRIWFGKHCDEIRVTVVKETSSAAGVSNKEGVASDGKSSWFRGKRSRGLSLSSATLDSKRAQELFRKSMQNFSLYEEEPSPLDQTAVVQAEQLVKADVPLEEPSLQPGDGSLLDENRSEDNGKDEATTQEDSQVSVALPAKDAAIPALPDSTPLPSLSTQPPADQ